MKVEVIVDTSQYQALGPKMPQVMKKGVNYTANYMIERLQVNSPIDTGYLKGWFRYKETDSMVDIRSPAHYAGWVNDGHSQQPCRFIPGTWKGGKFRYDRNAKTGMVLKKSHVEGKKFVEKSINATKGRIDGFFIKAIQEVLK